MSSPDRDPVEIFEEALADLEFDRARELADREDGPRKDRMIERVRVGLGEATDRAEKLAARIQFLARADHYEGLLALAADPATERLLGLLSTELRRGAQLHLRRRDAQASPLPYRGPAAHEGRFRGTRPARHGQGLPANSTRSKPGGSPRSNAPNWQSSGTRPSRRTQNGSTSRTGPQPSSVSTPLIRPAHHHGQLGGHGTGTGPAPERTPAPGDSSQGSRSRRGGCFGSLVIALAILALAASALAR